MGAPGRIDGWEYRRPSRTAHHFPVSSVDLATTVGLSVTMPCKQAVMLEDRILPRVARSIRLFRPRAFSPALTPTWWVSPRLFAMRVRSRTPLPASALILVPAPRLPRHSPRWRAGDNDVDRRCTPLRWAWVGCCCSIAPGRHHRTGSGGQTSRPAVLRKRPTHRVNAARGRCGSARAVPRCT